VARKLGAFVAGVVIGFVGILKVRRAAMVRREIRRPAGERLETPRADSLRIPVPIPPFWWGPMGEC
jgi:hypothetical protein